MVIAIDTDRDSYRDEDEFELAVSVAARCLFTWRHLLAALFQKFIDSEV